MTVLKNRQSDQSNAVVIAKYPNIEAGMSDKALLESAGINAQFIGESVNSLYPMLGFADVKLYVLEEDKEKAEQLLGSENQVIE